MEAVKSELGASFPLAPCREEQWGAGMGRWNGEVSQRQRGGSRDRKDPRATAAAPLLLLVKLWGAKKRGQGSRGLCSHPTRLQLSGGRGTG